jgi:ATP-dependent exoDNAse (exonuclease V) alpha subunit
LRWGIDHGRIFLDARHVVILDEAAMTNDRDLVHLLKACDTAGAKVILVGDHRQLPAVGPGGAFGALLERHYATVQFLGDNLRQRDPEEREILKELRSGDVERAVDWYLDHDRIHVSPDRDAVLKGMADAWVRDTLAGHDSAMYAWQRRNVDELNELARERWRAAGGLFGPELETAGGRSYQAGDLIVTLSPGRDTVTSERGHVLEVRPDTQTLIARMDDGRVVHLAGEQADRQHLAHGYATTVHRSQGATVDRAHRLEDGGGRELAYVSMSRAHGPTHTWVAADDRNQAREDLTRDWGKENRVEWAIDLVAAGLQREPDLDRGVERGLGRSL